MVIIIDVKSNKSILWECFLFGSGKDSRRRNHHGISCIQHWDWFVWSQKSLGATKLKDGSEEALQFQCQSSYLAHDSRRHAVGVYFDLSSIVPNENSIHLFGGASTNGNIANLIKVLLSYPCIVCCQGWWQGQDRKGWCFEGLMWTTPPEDLPEIR